MRILNDNPFQHVGQLEGDRPKVNAREQWDAFGQKLRAAIDEVDGLEKESHQMTQDFVLGRIENLHDVMIAAEKARTAMNLTLEVRNKALEAYKEIMRMQF